MSRKASPRESRRHRTNKDRARKFEQVLTLYGVKRTVSTDNEQLQEVVIDLLVDALHLASTEVAGPLLDIGPGRLPVEELAALAIEFWKEEASV